MVDLKLPQVAVCDRHGEPFRKQWPLGYAQLVILTVEFIQESQDLHDETGGDTAKIGEVLLERPVCERVDLGRIRQAYVDAGIGVAGRCIVCGRERLGTEYQRTVRGRLGRPKVVTDAHVCFECVLTRMAPANG